jgi:hypothetical protein
MARTNLPTHSLVPNGAIAAPAGTAIDATNGMNIVFPTTGIPAGPNGADLFLIVNNTYTAAENVTIDAGVNPPAFRNGIGALVVSVGASGTEYIGPFDTARFAQSDGSLNLDFGAAMTGTVTAIIMPRRW